MNPINFAPHAGSNPWFFLGASLLLGAFHGLEPGHSKGIMMAFMVGTRGTYAQALVLALCATLSHTAVVWLLALPASYGGLLWSTDKIEHYLNLVSGIMILALAYWMWRRLNRLRSEQGRHGQRHSHGDHHHDHAHPHAHEHVHSSSKVASSEALVAALGDEDDEHARHHIRELGDRFSGQSVSTAQVALFGLSSGLAPCSAAVVILITCFRLHQVWLGICLVGAFSVGLGITLASIALLAAWGVRAIGVRSKSFQELVRKAPLLSAVITAGLGIYLIVQFFRSF